MIILDNTVLTSLAHLDLLAIPFEMFNEVVISENVYEEGVTDSGDEERVKRIEKAIDMKQIEIISPSSEEKRAADRYGKTLGSGETSCLGIAIERNCLFATDDLKARKSAKELSVDVIGTLGILRLAYQEEILNEKELRDKLSDLHEILYFTEELERWVLSTIDR